MIGKVALYNICYRPPGWGKMYLSNLKKNSKNVSQNSTSLSEAFKKLNIKPPLWPNHMKPKTPSLLEYLKEEQKQKIKN